ncbi:MAG: SulP family inorganic anion transporter [Methylococcales bacterium]|nr:SulP family inorganic anion transporter [Methylococcales bacterium]
MTFNYDLSTNAKLFQVKKIFKHLLLADLVAGLSVAFILLPEAVAYAAIAHLTIQAAITAALLGLMIYAFLGESPYAIVAPTSSAAALLAAVVLSMRPSDTGAMLNLGAALVILTGVGLLVFSKAKLGRLSAFVSRPVLHGFSFALAVTIISKQIPVFLGVSVQAPNLYTLYMALFSQIHEVSIWSLFIGGSGLLLLLVLKQWPTLPSAFIVLVLGIVLSASLNLADYHIATVGMVLIQVPNLDIPQLSIEKWVQLGELAFGLMVIIVAESWGSIRSLSLIHGNKVDSNRELLALGAANLASGLLQGMPVGAGFSVSSANEDAGARTKMSGVFAAGVLFLMTVFGQQWIALIPQPIVAAAVINALGHALNPKNLVYLWRIDRDQYLALAAIMAVLVFGVLHGMLLAVGLSIAAAIRSFSQPVVRELAELGKSRDYVDRESHPKAVPQLGVLILRPEAPLFFASVEGLLAEMYRRLKARKDVKVLIVSLEQSANLDSTAAESLIEFAEHLARHNKVLLLARVKDPLRHLLLKLAPEQFRHKMYWSVADAVVGAQKIT